MAENNTAIVSFSGRRSGNCAQIAEYVRSLTGGEIYSFAELDIHPCGKCDYQCFGSGADCPFIDDDVYRLYDAITHSDRAIFVLPNYCDFPNANFFAFNERSLCYFSKRQDLLDDYSKVPKKFIVISSSESEPIRAALSQHADPPDILFLSASAYGKKSIAGDLMTVPDASAAIQNFIQ